MNLTEDHIPVVSVVIPTRNSSRTLNRCLKSISEQTYRCVETIVVDSGSTDGTQEIAANLADAVFDEPLERSAARNCGFARSRGSYVLFIDSDMYLSPSVVEECVALAAQGESAIVIPEVAVGEGFWASCRAMEKELYMGDNAIEAARFFPREVFEKLGGFDATLGPAGEDWDLTMRARAEGCRVARINSVVYHDEDMLTLRGAMRKKYFYGRYFKRFFQRYGSTALRNFAPWRGAYVRNLRRALREPTRMAGLVILKTSEFFAAAIGMIRST